MSFPTLTRRDVWRLLRNERGRPLREVSWTRQYLDALDDPTVRLILLWMSRQAGKSTHLLAGFASALFTRPGSYSVYLAAAERQAEAVFARKLRRPLERLARELGIEDALRVTQRTIEVPDLGSAGEFMATNEATVPGRSVDDFYVDEARDIPDGVFEVLVPSVIGTSGKIIVASTAGAPRGWFYELVTHPPAGTLVIHPDANENPEASPEVLGFLGRLFGLFPAAGRRELHNEFTDSGDELLAPALIEAAIDDRLGEVSFSERDAFQFDDLSRKRDLTSKVTVVREPPRRPEATDHLTVVSIETWNPRESPTGEVDFAEVRGALARDVNRFPNLRAVLVDEGAEAGSVLPFCRQHPRLSLLVQPFTASVASNMDLWGALAARLNAGTISIPRHERLIAELRGLRRQEFAFGSKWRVVDASRRLHRDVSLALAGAVMAAGTMARCEICGEPGCDGYHLLFTGRRSEPTPLPALAISDDETRATADERAALLALLEPALLAAEAGDEAEALRLADEVERFVAERERADPPSGARLRALLTRVERALEDFDRVPA